MIRHLRPALVLVALFTALTGLALPLGFVGAASAILPTAAGGSLVQRDGHVVGSSLLGQGFTQDKYLQGRPSATTTQDPAHPDDSTKTVPAPYNAANSTGSNAAPTSKALVDRVTADLKTAGPTPVPGDMLTTSGSGLDPDVSPQTAARQVARIASARHLPPEQVLAIIGAHTGGRLLGIVGEPRVNVLETNLALDAAQP
ncbi:MAG: potassium-transporting ATPase subunit KdpC [Janthinobacterium lividum]